MKKIGLSYEEFTAELQKHGWGFHEVDQSWRAKADDPLSEPAASIEALQDFCEIWPALTKCGLDVLLAGHCFDISISEDGYETIVRLRPSIELVRMNPDVFARPVKLRYV